MQQALFDPAPKVDADRAHVAHDLARRFLEGEIDALLTAPAGRIGKMRGNAGLAGPGGAGHQQAATAEIALAAEHAVEFGNAGGDDVPRRRVIQIDRGDRQDGDALLVDQERIFVGAVGGAAILHDAQAAGGDLVGDPLVE